MVGDWMHGAEGGVVVGGGRVGGVGAATSRSPSWPSARRRGGARSTAAMSADSRSMIVTARALSLGEDDDLPSASKQHEARRLPHCMNQGPERQGPGPGTRDQDQRPLEGPWTKAWNRTTDQSQ